MNFAYGRPIALTQTSRVAFFHPFYSCFHLTDCHLRTVFSNK